MLYDFARKDFFFSIYNTPYFKKLLSQNNDWYYFLNGNEHYLYYEDKQRLYMLNFSNNGFYLNECQLNPFEKDTLEVIDAF